MDNIKINYSHKTLPDQGKHMLTTTPVITVDGPSGAGKGTLCKLLAEYFNWPILDSGAIYRVLALAALHHNVSIKSEDALVSLAETLNVYFIVKNSKLLVILEGIDVSNKIRTETIGNVASRIAELPSVRNASLRRQRVFRKKPGLIADGRDMGTVVFPDATVKIFLDASLEERTQRRWLQLQENGFNVKIETLLAEIRKRDERDHYRMIAPLVPASDAFLLDSTRLSIQEVIRQSLGHIYKVFSLLEHWR